MPYPRALYFVLTVVAVIAVGFWPSYFSVWGTAAWQFHAHGIVASIWVIMVAVQSWTAQNKSRFTVHRATGQASLFLFPFLTAGLCAIIDRTAKGFIAHDDPVRMMYSGSFLIGMVVALAAYVTVFHRALKFRRNVWAHAGDMLSTPLILFESPFSRVLGMYVEPFIVRGPADFGRIMPSILWSMALELAVIALIWLRYRAKAKPFLVAGVFIAVQMASMGLLNDLPLLKELMIAIGNAPSAAIYAIGFVIGALTSWTGWQAGKRPAQPKMLAVQV